MRERRVREERERKKEEDRGEKGEDKVRKRERYKGRKRGKEIYIERYILRERRKERGGESIDT